MAPEGRGGTVNIFFLVPVFALCVVSNTLEQVFFRLAGGAARHGLWFFVAGSACYGVSLISFMWLLRFVPFNVALPMTGLSYVGVALAGQVCFGEVIHGRRRAGIAVIIAGIAVMAQGLPA